MNLSLTTWRASLFVTLGLAVACSGGPGTTETGASSSDSDSDTGNTGSTSDTGNTSVGESTTSGASDPTSGATEGGTGGTTTAGTSATTSATSGETTTATTDPTTEPTTDGTTTGAPLCEGAVDVLQWDGTPSGFVECPNGAILREEAVVCSIEPADDVKCEFAGTCTVDADCNAQPGGQCVIDEFFGECGCVYPGCESDEDCDAGMICDCGVVGQVPQCIPGDCVTNDDCGDYGCRLFDADPDCYMMQVACHGPDDLCYADSECEVGQKCFIQEGVFQCNFGGCAIGRPFLVAGAARTASVRAGAEGWRAVGLRPTRAAEAAAAQVAH
ncbi:MAG: hypothetical protein KC468_07685, partial [Myxococcales bacterium]|nr:hypothetical protein [Myxococcales bacterium]